MHIVFIQPNMGGPGESPIAVEPLELAVLAALTPSDMTTVLYDERLETINFDAPADLAVITVDTFTAKRSYEISQAYGSRGVPVAMIGPHVALVPQEVRDHCDSMVIGPAEDRWPQVMEDLKLDRLKREYRCDPGTVPQAGVLPRRELFKRKKYLPITAVRFSRGCTWNCRHCICSTQSRSCRPVEEVVQELRQQRRKLIFFTDGNICSHKEQAKELLRQLIPLKLHWVARSSLEAVEDPELLRLMVKSGCAGLIIGFESIQSESIRLLDKTVNPEHCRKYYAKAIRTLRQQGLPVWGVFTLGHDGDTVDSILDTAYFVQNSKISFATFHTLTPLPGTELYRQLQQENRLLYDGVWWLHPQYRFGHAVFKPRNMNASELKEAAFCCRMEHHRFRSRLRRLWSLNAKQRSFGKLRTYCKYDRLLRQEVFEQQGMALGCTEPK